MKCHLPLRKKCNSGYPFVGGHFWNIVTFVTHYTNNLFVDKQKTNTITSLVTFMSSFFQLMLLMPGHNGPRLSWNFEILRVACVFSVKRSRNFEFGPSQFPIERKPAKILQIISISLLRHVMVFIGYVSYLTFLTEVNNHIGYLKSVRASSSLEIGLFDMWSIRRSWIVVKLPMNHQRSAKVHAKK